MAQEATEPTGPPEKTTKGGDTAVTTKGAPQKQGRSSVIDQYHWATFVLN